MRVRTIMLSGLLMAGNSLAILPDSLTLDVGDFDSDGQDETLVLTKRSVRSATNYQLLTWTTAGGYTNHAPTEVRTYRGYVQDDPSMRINGGVEPGGILNANFSDGRENIFQIDGMTVSVSGPDGTFDPGTGNVEIPLAVSRVSPTANGGYTIPKYTMRRAQLAFDVQYDYYEAMGFDLDATVARVEQRFHDFEQFMARDIGLALELTTVVVRIEPLPDYKNVWDDDWDNDAIPGNPQYNRAICLKAPSGAVNSGNFFKVGDPDHRQANNRIGGTVFWARGFAHEMGHSFDLGHGVGHNGLMQTESCVDWDTVQTMITHLHIAPEGAAPAITYGVALTPYAMLDLATVVPGQTVDIDLLENDYDGNGDAVSLSYVDSTSQNGGTISIVSGGTVRYTPPVGFQGQDTFAYYVEDATGLTNRNGDVTVCVRDGDLASRYRFDETSGSILNDDGPFQAHGTLTDGLSFDNSGVGIVSNALEKISTSGSDARVLVDTARTGDPMDGDFSVSLWVNYSSAPTENAVLISKGGAGLIAHLQNRKGAPGWAIGHIAGQGFRFIGTTSRAYYDESDRFDLEWNGTIEPDTWYHLVMTMDRSNQTLRAWINNVETTTTVNGAHIREGWIYSQRGPLALFASEGGNDPWSGPGKIDEVRLYHKALTDTEITWLYLNPADTPAGAQVPVDGQVDVDVGTALNWVPITNSPSVVFDVYFGTNSLAVLNATTNSPEYLGRQVTTTAQPSTIAGTQYFWRIDEVVGATTATGAVWSFTTSRILNKTDFETDFGEWINVSGVDSNDWSIGSGKTPSGSTGPSSGANGSSRYAYLETSTSAGGADDPGDTAFLESPEFEFGYGRELSFYYHMYGDTMGSLNVDVYSGGSWSNAVWSISGEQQTDDTDPYTQAIVDLSSFSGPIKLRIRGVAAGGYRGDMAIDSIKVVSNDLDEDGMPDAWETQFFTNGVAASPSDNEDGDAHSNLEEFIASTDPTNALDYLSISITSSNVFYQSSTNCHYSIEWSDNLSSNVWNSLTNLPGSGGEVSITDTNDLPATYYRVKAERL